MTMRADEQSQNNVSYVYKNSFSFVAFIGCFILRFPDSAVLGYATTYAENVLFHLIWQSVSGTWDGAWGDKS